MVIYKSSQINSNPNTLCTLSGPPSFVYSFIFLLRIEEHNLRVNYVKKSYPDNWTSLFTRTNLMWVSDETFTSKERERTFQINKFKWKHPATEMSSEIIFFQKFVDNILQKHLLCISSKHLLQWHFWRFQLQILWFSFQNIFQKHLFWYRQ